MPLYCLPLGLSGLPCLFFSQISSLINILPIFFYPGACFPDWRQLFHILNSLKYQYGDAVCMREKGDKEKSEAEKRRERSRRGGGGGREESAEGSE